MRESKKHEGNKSTFPSNKSICEWGEVCCWPMEEASCERVRWKRTQQAVDLQHLFLQILHFIGVFCVFGVSWKSLVKSPIDLSNSQPLSAKRKSIDAGGRFRRHDLTILGRFFYSKILALPSFAHFFCKLTFTLFFSAFFRGMLIAFMAVLNCAAFGSTLFAFLPEFSGRKLLLLPSMTSLYLLAFIWEIFQNNQNLIVIWQLFHRLLYIQFWKY